VPLYEYQCPRCGRFELIHKFSDAPLATCPTCGSEVQKLPSAPAIQFKGTGWYITDYARKSSGGSEAKNEGATASKDGSSAKESSPKDSSPTSSSKEGSTKEGSTGGTTPK
jgi:putative FmdB family regulatory protein